jgi:hypothetical protein
MNRGAGFDVSPLVVRVYGNIKNLVLFPENTRFGVD